MAIKLVADLMGTTKGGYEIIAVMPGSVHGQTMVNDHPVYVIAGYDKDQDAAVTWMVNFYPIKVCTEESHTQPYYVSEEQHTFVGCPRHGKLFIEDKWHAEYYWGHYFRGGFDVSWVSRDSNGKYVSAEKGNKSPKERALYDMVKRAEINPDYLKIAKAEV